jgi:hypothetical protein
MGRTCGTYGERQSVSRPAILISPSDLIVPILRCVLCYEGLLVSGHRKYHTHTHTPTSASLGSLCHVPLLFQNSPQKCKNCVSCCWWGKPRGRSEQHMPTFGNAWRLDNAPRVWWNIMRCLAGLWGTFWSSVAAGTSVRFRFVTSFVTKPR